MKSNNHAGSEARSPLYTLRMQPGKTIDQVSGVILCGGAGTRMGHRDKPLIVTNDLPLVAHIAHATRPCVTRLMISCNRNFDAYAPYADVLIKDRDVGRGPLEGIRAALSACTTNWLLVSAGDCPKMTVGLFEHLLRGEGPGALVAFDGTTQQNLFCVLGKQHLAVAETALASGSTAIHRFLALCQATRVDCTDYAAQFANMNRTSDLEPPI